MVVLGFSVLDTVPLIDCEHYLEEISGYVVVVAALLSAQPIQQLEPKTSRPTRTSRRPIPADR